jgi:hypothetical protein
MKGPSVLALIMIVLSYCGLSFLLGQKREPAAVFRPALEQIQSKTRIPILLPSRLPSRIRERDIKLADGEVRKDGYFISLYFSELGSNATYAAGFGGSTSVVRDLPNMRRLKLAGGRVGMFSPVSCGGSCAPANLWWEQNGVQYQIQIKLPPTLTEEEQERILVEAADSTVVALRE